MQEKYFAIIEVVFEMDIDNNSLIVKLSDSDIRKIFKILRKLKTEISSNIFMAEMEMIKLDIIINSTTRIKIIHNQLYVLRNNVQELLIDENYLIRDLVFKKAIKKSHDDIKKVIQLIYPPNSKRGEKQKYKSFTLSNTRYITPLPRCF